MHTHEHTHRHTRARRLARTYSDTHPHTQPNQAASMQANKQTIRRVIGEGAGAGERGWRRRVGGVSSPGISIHNCIHKVGTYCTGFLSYFPCIAILARWQLPPYSCLQLPTLSLVLSLSVIVYINVNRLFTGTLHICIYSQGCPVDGVGVTIQPGLSIQVTTRRPGRSGRGDMVLGKQQQNVQRKEGDKGR